MKMFAALMKGNTTIWGTAVKRDYAKEKQRDEDKRDLHKFGYAQELFRDMGGFSNFAISFSIISVLTGAVSLYGHGLTYGGTGMMGFGWPGRPVRPAGGGGDGGIGIGDSHRGRFVPLGLPAREQAMGLVYGLDQPDRPDRHRGRNRLFGGHFHRRPPVAGAGLPDDGDLHPDRFRFGPPLPRSVQPPGDPHRRAVERFFRLVPHRGRPDPGVQPRLFH